MSLAALFVLSLALETPPTLHTVDLGDRIAVSGPSWAMARLLDGRPALEWSGGEMALDLVERSAGDRERMTALYAPRAPLVDGRRYALKSWPGTAFERRPATGQRWNGTIEVLELGAAARLRFTPSPVAALARVELAGRVELVPVEEGAARVVDLPPGRSVLGVTLLDRNGTSETRRFEIVSQRAPRHKGCRPSATWRVASRPTPAPWSVWQRLAVFGALPFAAGYVAVALALRSQRRAA